MSNVPEISIIVPVYKVEEYLSQCIDSILVQTFTNFELLLVDDGSPDRCGEMCEEYRNKKTSKLSRTPRPCKKSLKGFSFKLRQCYLKINLSLYLKNKTSITYSENFKIQFLPLPNLPIYSKHLAYEKNLFSILLPNN